MPERRLLQCEGVVQFPQRDTDPELCWLPRLSKVDIDFIFFAPVIDTVDKIPVLMFGYPNQASYAAISKIESILYF